MRDHDTPPPKKDVARALLLRGSVFVYLDPRLDDVDVPPQFKQQAQLVIQVGLDMVVPIVDLRVDDEGVFGTLSFSRTPYTCSVPWRAVFALMGDDGTTGMVWRDDLPSEIAQEVDDVVTRSQRAKPRLTAIDGGAMDARAPARPPRKDETPAAAHALHHEAEEPEPTDADTAEPKPARSGLPPYLRVIK